MSLVCRNPLTIGNPDKWGVRPRCPILSRNLQCAGVSKEQAPQGRLGNLPVPKTSYSPCELDGTGQLDRFL